MWQVGPGSEKRIFFRSHRRKVKSRYYYAARQHNEQDMYDKSEKETKLAQEKMGNNYGLKTLAICGILVFLKDKFKLIVIVISGYLLLLLLVVNYY